MCVTKLAVDNSLFFVCLSFRLISHVDPTGTLSHKELILVSFHCWMQLLFPQYFAFFMYHYHCRLYPLIYVSTTLLPLDLFNCLHLLSA